MDATYTSDLCMSGPVGFFFSRGVQLWDPRIVCHVTDLLPHWIDGKTYDKTVACLAWTKVSSILKYTHRENWDFN